MLWQFQVNSKGTPPYMYMYPFSPKPPVVLSFSFQKLRSDEVFACGQAWARSHAVQGGCGAGRHGDRDTPGISGTLLLPWDFLCKNTGVGKPRWKNSNMFLNMNQPRSHLLVKSPTVEVDDLVERRKPGVRQIQVWILAFEPTSYTLLNKSLILSQLNFPDL